MSNSKISALTSASTPLAGTEVLPIVQSSTTKQVSVANLTAGRAITALTYGGFTIASQYLGVSGQSGIYTGSSAVLPTNGTSLGDNTISMGSSFWRWSVIYAGTALINTSDSTLKQDVNLLTDKEKRVAVAIKGLIRTYRFKDAVVAKGDAARIHVGVMAQDVKAAFEAEELDASRYGMFCSDTIIDEETKESKTRFGVRYEELLAFVISAL